MCPRGGQQSCWQGFGGGELMAEGVACSWGTLGLRGSPRPPSALRQEKAPGFSELPHVALGKQHGAKGCQGHTTQPIS